MKNITGFLALFIFSAAANADQQLLTYSGHFISLSGPNQGNIALSDQITGQFTFNPNAPDTISSLTSPYSGFDLNYSHVSASVTKTKDGQSLTGTDIFLEFKANDTVDFTAANIAKHGFTNTVTAGATYDMVSIGSQTVGSTWDTKGNLYSGYQFSMFALFNPATFSLADFNNTQNYQNIFNFNPVFMGFEVTKASNGIVDFQDAGLIVSPNVSSVPVPAATWLFLSGLISVLSLSKRKSAFIV